MKAKLAAAGAGALFGVGLAISGMTKPAKVVGFLDVAGDWDASLAFVMMGAVAVHALAYRLVTRRRAPLFDVRFHLPTRRDVDGKLVLGAALFGVGWGLGGFCPGPGLVAAAAGGTAAIVFVIGMTLGMFAEGAFAGLLRRSASAQPGEASGAPGNQTSTRAPADVRGSATRA